MGQTVAVRLPPTLQEIIAVAIAGNGYRVALRPPGTRITCVDRFPGVGSNARSDTRKIIRIPPVSGLDKRTHARDYAA